MGWETPDHLKHKAGLDSLLKLTQYALKKNFELNLSEVGKKKISYHFIIFHSHSPLNFLVRSEAKVKLAKTPWGRLLSQYSWLTKNFLEKASFHEISVPIP